MARSFPHVTWRVTASLMVLSLLACTSGLLDPTDQRELAEATARWQGQRLLDYAFDYHRDCFCPDGGRQVHITVRGGQVADVAPIDSLGPLDRPMTSDWPTVDTILANLNALSTASSDVYKGYRFDATYDATLGYPTHIELIPPSNMMDGGSREGLAGLTPLFAGDPIASESRRGVGPPTLR